VTGRLVHVNDARRNPLPPEVRDRIRSASLAALASGSVGGPDPGIAEVSVTLLDSARMRELNVRYHGVDAPTDVLAFDLGTAGGTLLGDIYVCVDVARESAEEYGETLDDELARLAIHGTLHLLGHDHPEGARRQDCEMFRLQERLLKQV
jgi:probable rRNA maturation factor